MRAILMASLGLWAVGGCAEAPSCDDSPELCVFEVRSEIHNRDLEQAIDIVFVGEGYLEEDLAAFHADVDAFKASMGRTTIYLTARAPEMFNFHTVSATSQTREVVGDYRRDTAMGGGLLPDPLDSEGQPFIEIDEATLDKYASLAPDADVVVAVVRESPGRAHASGSIKISSHSADPDNPTFVHELGHAVFGLADEYSDVDQCITSRFPSLSEADLLREPNVSLSPTGHKWRHVLGATVPAFEGGSRFDACIFHPAPRCMMNDDNGEFCAVCAAEIEAVLSSRRCGHERLPPRVHFEVVPGLERPHWSQVFLALHLFDHSDEAWVTVTLDDAVLFDGPEPVTEPDEPLEMALAIPRGPDGQRRLCVRAEDAFGQHTRECEWIEVRADPLQDGIEPEPPEDWPTIGIVINDRGGFDEVFVGSEAKVSWWVSSGDSSAPMQAVALHVDKRAVPLEWWLRRAGTVRFERDSGRRERVISILMQDAEGRRAWVRRTVWVDPPDPAEVTFTGPVFDGARVSGVVPVALRFEGGSQRPPRKASMRIEGGLAVPMGDPAGVPLGDAHTVVGFFDTTTYVSGPIQIDIEVEDGWGWPSRHQLHLEIDHTLLAHRPRIEAPARFGIGSPVEAHGQDGGRLGEMSLWWASGGLAPDANPPYLFNYPASDYRQPLGFGGERKAVAVATVDGAVVGSKSVWMAVADPRQPYSIDDFRTARSACELRPADLRLGCQTTPGQGWPSNPLWGLIAAVLLGLHARRAQV